MSKQGNLIVLSGPSGVGKGTILSEVLQKFTHLQLSVSATTRPKRKGEIDLVDYRFMSVVEFKKMIDANEFLEWCIVHDNFYGTVAADVNDRLSQGIDVILEIDTQGFKKLNPNQIQFSSIFIAPPSMAELSNRLIKRNTEPSEVIKRRLAIAEKELAVMPEYDYIIENHTVGKSVQQLISIINKLNNKVG